jgi:hypothetical protein
MERSRQKGYFVYLLKEISKDNKSINKCVDGKASLICVPQSGSRVLLLLIILLSIFIIIYIANIY